MKDIYFVDVTLRDAHQSLWGDKMTIPMAYQIAPEMNRAGFKAMDITGPGYFSYSLRYLREDPWERIRLISKAVPDTTLACMMLGTSLSIFSFIRGPIMSVWMERLAANGIKRVQLLEASNNMEDLSENVEYAKNAGLQVVLPLVYSHSPIHTDEYYAERTRNALELEPDIIYLKDSGGLLTPERTRTLIPVMLQNIDDIPFEIHSHCTTGLGPHNYLEAMRLGVTTFHTASSPLANGPSLPSIEHISENARFLGYSSHLDKKALEAIATHFEHVAQMEGFPKGSPVLFDLSQYEHQIPGGVISNLIRQLSELGFEDRLDEVLTEVIQVRKDLGYPIMVTPVSQFVVTQASLNVTQGERYKSVIDEVIQFALGHYGKQPVPVDTNIMDRINELPRTKELRHWEPPITRIEDLRRTFGSDLSDDDLLLMLLSSKEDLKAMRAKGPAKTEYSSVNKPLVAFIKELMKQKKPAHIHIQKENFSLTLRKKMMS